MKRGGVEMVHATKSIKGAKWYLLSPSDITTFVDFISWAQTKSGIFENVTIKPYKGKKYNCSFQWVVVG